MNTPIPALMTQAWADLLAWHAEAVRIAGWHAEAAQATASAAEAAQIAVLYALRRR